MGAAVGPATAEIPAAAFRNENLTAADVQRMTYDELVRRGVAREVAALATMDTQVVRNEPDHLQIVQTMIGGIRRELDVRLTPGSAGNTRRVPMKLDDGTVALGERVAMKRSDNGFSTSGTVYLPNAEPSARLLERWGRPRKSNPWIEWLGIGTANAQGIVGVAMSYGDSFVGSAGNAIGVPNLTVQGVVDVAKKVSSDPGVKDVQTVARVAEDIIDAMSGPEPVPEGPKTLWQTRAETMGTVAKVLKYGYKAYSIYKKDDARRSRLQALEDCARNPTNPLAKRAQREDPNYQRATTDVVDSARLNLTLNTGLVALTTLGNTVAGELLKKASPATGAIMAKGVSYANSVEGTMLEHVADNYIMKDAGKGIVPCEPDCGPVYRPEPPSQDLASYPPAEWSGSSSADGLVCTAAPAASSSAPSFTPGPLPAPPPDPSSATCGPLKEASFSYLFHRESGGCDAVSCETDVQDVQFTGSVPLKANGAQGYVGIGKGEYSSLEVNETKTSVQCGAGVSRGTVQGRADMEVNALRTIDNKVTGGVDTSAMPKDTSVVEALFESHNLHQDNYSHQGCEKPEAWSNDEAADGLGCYFYGVDLYRPGFYVARANNDPAGGVCTLKLSR
jgi:hypothetical protein